MAFLGGGSLFFTLFLSFGRPRKGVLDSSGDENPLQGGYFGRRVAF